MLKLPNLKDELKTLKTRIDPHDYAGRSARWVKGKIDLKNRVKTTAVDLFRFKSKVLNPAATELIGKFNAASGAATSSEKVEQLLAVREESDKTLYGISGKQTDKSMTGMWMFLGAFIALTIPGVFVGGTIALPAIAYAAFAVGGAGVGYIGKLFLNSGAADHDREALASRINTDVKKLAKAEPQEAAKSPRFLEAIRDAFRSSVYNNETYKDLTVRVQPRDDYREDYHDFDRAISENRRAAAAEASQAAKTAAETPAAAPAAEVVKTPPAAPPAPKPSA
jgi:hypothetical protein